MRVGSLWVIVLVLLATTPVRAALPSGCEAVDEDTVACRWTFAVSPTALFFHAEIPVSVGFSLATVVVTLINSADTGWAVEIAGVSEDGEGGMVSRSEHEARPALALRHRDESTHVLRALPGDRFALTLAAGYVKTSLPATTSGVSPTGSYDIAYIASRIPEGTHTSRPAATANDPHVIDEPREVAEEAWDIRSVWWDDAREGDGLFDVHLTLGSLANLTADSFRSPLNGGQGKLAWKASWTVEGGAFYVQWRLDPDSIDDGIVNKSEFDCQLMTESFDQTVAETVRANPLCDIDLDNATLHAIVPAASSGAPENGQLFRDLAGRTRIQAWNGWDVVEEANKVQYLFALGGPAVWSVLNPRLDPEEPVRAAWYEAPLAAENQADTLQVLATFAALATFLVGLLLVVRRRRHTSRLLARVDAIEDQGVDAKDTLLLLGRLEQEFSHMFRRHRISETQYQVLSQRIASVATRHSLRKQLGLDDGIPGEASASRRVAIDRP